MVRVVGSRVTLDSIVAVFDRGATPEEVVQSFRRPSTTWLGNPVNAGCAGRTRGRGPASPGPSRVAANTTRKAYQSRLQSVAAPPHSVSRLYVLEDGELDPVAWYRTGPNVVAHACYFDQRERFGMGTHGRRCAQDQVP